jgi:ethanolamine utilization protein EutN
MRIARVIGSVTLNRVHPSLGGCVLRLAVPLAWSELAAGAPAAGLPAGESLVLLDELGAGCGSQVALSEGVEAAQPFFPEYKPVDAYCAAILDRIDVEPPP